MKTLGNWLIIEFPLGKFDNPSSREEKKNWCRKAQNLTGVNLKRKEKL
jgi:hypothetical protein